MKDTSKERRTSQLLATARAVRETPSLLWQADAPLSVSLFALQVIQTLVPLGQLWVAKLIIDQIVSALRLKHPSGHSRDVIVLVAFEFLLAAVSVLLREVMNYQRRVLAERLTAHVSLSLLAHTQQLDLSILERPEFYDRLRRAEDGAFYRPAALLFQLLALVQGSVTLLAAMLILVRLQPFTLPLLLIAAIPYALAQSGTAVAFYSLSTGQTPEARQARYLSHLLGTDEGAKEIRVFGLGDYLLGRYRQILDQSQQRTAQLILSGSIRSGATSLLPVAVYAAIFAYFCLQALNRQLTVGDLTLYIGIVFRGQDALQQLVTNFSGVLENGLFLQDYQAFLQLNPVMDTHASGVRISLPIRWGVRFNTVTYRYPGGDHDVLSDVSLELRAGETVAIVGENGAGKTTLVKLLARLYDPDSGSITVDGRDLRGLDADAWRRQIAVIFQDFIHYFFTAGENIGFGQVEHLGEEERIRRAAERGGATSVISKLPGGFQTVLGRWFDGGMQLSGGEWQRLALSRAFMRDAPILVLDEPTASLDARSEYEVFSRFRELTRDRIVLLISHRFSTVRMADRIYVLDAGRIVETGDHDELMGRRGRYAELFQLQAAGYTS
jgi:ATP-binding cassette, subfamily B, bacterial